MLESKSHILNCKKIILWNCMTGNKRERFAMLAVVETGTDAHSLRSPVSTEYRIGIRLFLRRV